jgi:hypothetical protein
LRIRREGVASATSSGASSVAGDEWSRQVDDLVRRGQLSEAQAGVLRAPVRPLNEQARSQVRSLLHERRMKRLTPADTELLLGRIAETGRPALSSVGFHELRTVTHERRMGRLSEADARLLLERLF